MVESSIPARAADVAAPIRKLWPAYSCWENPSTARTARIRLTNHALVIGLPSKFWKNSPGRSCRREIYDRSADTGHRAQPVRPTTMFTPAPNWSHFDCFRWIFSMDGCVALSAATSPQAKSVVGLNLSTDSTRSSPRRKKPKNAVQAMAHRTTLSGSDDRDTAPWIRRSIGAVMGNLTRTAAPRASLARLIPACTRFNTGRDD